MVVLKYVLFCVGILFLGYSLYLILATPEGVSKQNISMLALAILSLFFLSLMKKRR